MKFLILSFFKDASGATAIEYGLLVGGLALAILAALNGTGIRLSGTFSNISTALK
jgi:pilus assembly protein Flp/PilA